MTSVIAAFRRHLSHECQLAQDTTERYVQAVTAFAATLPSDTADALMFVRPADVARFLQGEEEQAPSPARFNVQLSALKKFFAFLEREEIVMKNPASQIRHLEVVDHPREPLTLDEMLRLVDAVERTASAKLRFRDVAILQILFHCALRVTELVSLDLTQVDLGAFPVIRDVVAKDDKRLSVVLNDVVTEALERYLPARERLADPGGAPGLFLSQRGTRLSVRSVEELVKHYAESARITRPATPHVLRHSSATELIEFTDIRTVQEHLHHASVLTTQRYTHVKESKERAAVNELGRRYRRAAGRRSVAA